MLEETRQTNRELHEDLAQLKGMHASNVKIFGGLMEIDQDLNVVEQQPRYECPIDDCRRSYT